MICRVDPLLGEPSKKFGGIVGVMRRTPGLRVSHGCQPRWMQFDH
jgi:hypothetical protein